MFAAFPSLYVCLFAGFPSLYVPVSLQGFLLEFVCMFAGFFSLNLYVFEERLGNGCLSRT